MSKPNLENTILRSLNKAQHRAVTSEASTVAILAGPGSGKTHTLTSRVVWLIQHMGYRPSDVIVATFTIKAAREMKERIGKLLGEEVEKKIILGTFHSIARRYLSIYGRHIGLESKFNIADDGDSKAIIQRICKRLDLKVEPSYAKAWISKKKAKGTPPVNAPKSQKNKKQEHPDLARCFAEYQDHLERSNLVDFDDLLVKCVELLRKNPECVSNVQTVLIDEYQDTNGIQYELMKLFAQARERITIVGDPDQSIYGWRSAEVRNLYRLLREYPETEEVSLEENYRSSQYILDISLQVIEEDKNRYKKVLRPVHTKCTQPVLRSLGSTSTEGEWIVSEIKRLGMMFGGMLKNEDVAILLRSASLSRHIESALGKAGVAYQMIGGKKFYERREIKILLDYLRAVHQPDNNDVIARIINVPRRGVGDVTVKSLLEEAEQAKISVWVVLCKHCRGERRASTNIRANMEQRLSSGLLNTIFTLRKKADAITEDGAVTLIDLIDSLLNQLSFKRYLELEYPEEHETRWANVQEFMNLVKDFMRDYSQMNTDELPEIDNVTQTKEDDILGKFLANVSLASDAQRDDGDGDKSSMVTISTIHAAKGLEWPVVFVPSVYVGSIPHSRSEDIEEERRLLYVAMTRAQAMLYLSCPLYGPQGLSNKVELSNFVAPFASKAFAARGPSIDKKVLESVAKILGREAPPEKRVFDNLPSMFSPEDDTFPLSPIDPKNSDGTEENGEQHYARAPKRQRKDTEKCNSGNADQPLFKAYSTTMEDSSHFTMSSLPGFMTAGQARSTISASLAAKENQPSGNKKVTKGSTHRDPNQKSLLGFVSKGTGAAGAGPPEAKIGSSSLGKQLQHGSRPQISVPSGISGRQQPALDPALAQHKLGGGKRPMRPTVAKPGQDGAGKQYSCFSSSPPRQPPPEEPENEPSREVSASSRPATVFHSTTFTTAGSRLGVRRPVGMGPAPSLDRLRKPFKPLTMNRPKGR
ncbi:unnamed protein product [Clonostachys rosea f. rosea IK726]|uniref:DNA 3'-5' helicase n=2 Tax=Bionectria ochroleuca TaxID=29856 RepID=A0A0B7KMM5_BIOOC|nr:unnamed protein product [Clonostachys rosea f. rosea IK726]